ncbi:MAG: cell surface protein [Pirellulaceae bacterium]|nr:cell surface protein [Pirellulaceae bacterium]
MNATGCSGILRPVLLAFAASGAAMADDVTCGQAVAYLGPSATAVSSDGRVLFAALSDARQVAIVELPDASAIRRVRTPTEPTGLVLSRDGRRVYVTCAAAASSVLEIDAASGEITASFPAGHTATAPTLSPDDKLLYVCNRFDHNVSVIDLEHRKELARVAAVREPVAAAVTRDGRELWVANHLPAGPANQYGVIATAAVVTVINTDTLQTEPVRLITGTTSVRGIALTPDGKYALLVHILGRYHLPAIRVDGSWMNANALTVIDVCRREVLNTVLLDDHWEGAANPWGVTCTTDGRWICVSHAGTNELSVIDGPELLKLLGRLPLGAFSNAAFFDGSSYGFYTTSTGEDVVNEPGILTGIRRRVKLPGLGPRGLAACGSQVYVTEYFTDSLAAVTLTANKDATIHSIALGPKPQWNEVRLGEMLFHDGRVCFHGWQSCASCHPEGRADGLNWDLLNDGEGNPKNTKTLLFSHRTPPAMASGVRPTAEAAVRSGIKHILMSDRPAAEAAAIDVWLKSLAPQPSPFLVHGRLSPAAERGQQLFKSDRVACAKCHPAPLYTDLKAHDVGSRGELDQRATFDTPTLVEAWRTAPYMHDGRYTTIEQLLTEGKHGRVNKLRDEELAGLVQFVLSL